MARYLLRAFAIVYLFLLVAWPVSLVVTHTFANGFDALHAIFTSPDLLSALRLSAIAALAATVINTVFGVSVSLLLVRTQFPGQRILAPLAAGALFIELSIAILASGLESLGTTGPTIPLGFGNPAEVGMLMLEKFLIPFEAASMLLLVAAVGAVVLAARRDDRETARVTGATVPVPGPEGGNDLDRQARPLSDVLGTQGVSIVPPTKPGSGE